jgi:hypothetical protein
MKSIKSKIGMWLTIAVVGCAGACNQDPVLYGSEESVPEVLAITVSAEDITLNPDMAPNEAVLTVTWNEAAPRGQYDEIEYVFKIDLADNAFETAVREDIPTGVFSKTITYQELYDLLTEKWRVVLGSTVGVDVRIIATVYGPKFVQPEIATTRVNVKIFVPDPRPLYIVGSAVPDGGSDTDPAVKITMTEIVPGKEYTFNDSLGTGNLIFVDEDGLAALLPAYVKGVDDTTLVLCTDATQRDNNRFAISSGWHSITVRLDRGVVKISKKIIINGIEWAPANVDAFRTFATASDAAGKYYQFHGNTGYSDTDAWPGANGAGIPVDALWPTDKIPCPEGYQILSQWVGSAQTDEVLTSFSRTYRAAGTAGNSVNGVFFGPNSANATIENPGEAFFIPFAGYRDPATGTLTEYGEKAYIHTGNPYWGVSSQILVIDENSVTWNRQSASEPSNTYNWGMGASVRCIKTQ